MTHPAPLAGLRVIESSILGPAAITTAFVDLGADVIKVETPAGDYIREMTWPIIQGISLMHYHLNRGKKSITLDLKVEAARQIYRDLVKDADVVIVNPSEFAVALEYDEMRNAVPVVLAKGRGEIAASIKERAKLAGVPVVSAPPLARAIYFTTEVDDPIPEGLYRAVAAILAYVFRLSALSPGLQTPELPQTKLAPEYMFDEFGKPMAETDT